jgi:DNA ligase (NAD+)
MSEFDNPIVTEQIKKLNARLEAARDAYYKEAQPIMPDAEYDVLERQLRNLVQASPWLAEHAPVLRTVGSDVTSTGRVRHSRPMLSIENQYTYEDVLAWCAKLPPRTRIVLEPKFDGISCSLLYKYGRLVRALTRGTGTEGEDITPQAKAVSSIPKTLGCACRCHYDRGVIHVRPCCDGSKISSLAALNTLEVRGELVMKNSTLEAINAFGGKQYTSTRNLTAGTMKQGDLSIVASRDIMFMPWDVIGDDEILPDSSLARLQMLGETGFNPPFGNVVYSDDPDSIRATLDLKLADRESVMRRAMSLETDGVVIKVDSQKLRRQLGVASKYTNWQVCYKPQSASGTTYLREIVWQVGRTGRVSPVAKCDVVVLAGANVTSASLNNITYIRNMGLKLGAKVEMLRSGDVIPQIVRVIDEGDEEIFPPSNCPRCLMPLEEKDEGGEGIMQSYCVNSLCPGVLEGHLAFAGSRDVLEIDGLGPEMARKLVDGDYARNLWELYEFQTEMMEWLFRFGEEAFVKKMRTKGFDATLPKMLRSLEEAKTRSWERWIKALGIPMIGETLGKVIAAKARLKPNSMATLDVDLILFASQDVEQFGEAKMRAIRDWASTNGPFVQKLYGLGVRPAPVEAPQVVEGAPLAGTVFCITGEVDEDRKSLYAKLEKLGAAGKTGVSSKCNLLIVLPGAGKSKVAKAAQLGIKQVDKTWLEKTFADNGMPLKGNTFPAEES